MFFDIFAPLKERTETIMRKIALYSKQHALKKAKFQALMDRDGNNVIFATLPGTFQSVATLEAPITHVTTYFKDLDTNRIGEATILENAETISGRPWSEERINKAIARYKKQWPDAIVVSRNAERVEGNGRNWQEVLEENHLDLEAVLVETRSDRDMKTFYNNAKDVANTIRASNNDSGPV